MFSVEQIKAAHRKAKSGADFPNCHAVLRQAQDDKSKDCLERDNVIRG